MRPLPPSPLPIRLKLYALVGMADLDSLERQLAEATAAYADSKRDVKRKRQEVKDEKKIEKKQWKFTPFVVDVLLILFYLATYQSIVAVAYAQNVAGKTKWRRRDDEEVADLVYHLFLEADMEHFLELTSMTEDSSQHVRRARQAAVKFKAEFDAAQWAKSSNVNKGVAPPSDAVLSRMLQNRTDSGLNGDDDFAYLLNATSTGRSYVSRWRGRWGGRYGAIRVLSDITMDEANEKARALLGQKHFSERIPVLF